MTNLVKRAAFGSRRFAHDRIRALLDAGKPDGALRPGVTPGSEPKRRSTAGAFPASDLPASAQPHQ